MAMTAHAIRTSLAALLALLGACIAAPISAQDGRLGAPLSWADMADLSDAAQLVVRARIKKQAELEPERAYGVAPGYTRLYIEAETTALIAGSAPLGESLRYLVDVPLTAKGRAPKLKKQEVVLFARTVANRPGQIQLVARDAQFGWSEQFEQRLRPILTALAAADAPPPVTGIRDALSVAGNLSGESETQIFVETQTAAPLSISVVRRPGFAPSWGVSYSEIVDQAVRAPAVRTASWYRLACFLPRELPGAANLARNPADRARADADYRFVIERLGPCGRTRIPPMS